MRPEYIFMDLDGTISDPKEGITKAVAHALSYYGIQVENLDTLEKFIGPPLLDSFQDFYGFSEEQSREAVGKYREYFSRQGLFENVLYDGERIACGSYFTGKKDCDRDIKTGSIYCTDP